MATKSVEHVDPGARDRLRRLDSGAAGEHREVREARPLLVYRAGGGSSRWLREGSGGGPGASRGPAESFERRLQTAGRSTGESSPRNAPTPSLIASGRPSTRRQISAIASALSTTRDRKSGSCARARSQNSATASESAYRLSSPARRLGKRERRHGITAPRPATASGSRLVAITSSRPGHATASTPADDTAAPGSCARRSSSDQQQVLGGEEAHDRLMRRFARERRDRERVDNRGGHVRGPVVLAASETKTRRPGKAGFDSPVRPRAQGVSCRPHPGPVNVNSRTDALGRRSPSATSSCMRPIVRFGGAGKTRAPCGVSVKAGPAIPGSWARIACWRS